MPDDNEMGDQDLNFGGCRRRKKKTVLLGKSEERKTGTRARVQGSAGTAPGLGLEPDRIRNLD